VIRTHTEIRLDEIDPVEARAAVDAHQRSLDWSGDDYMSQRWLAATHRRVVVDGRPVGVAGWGEQDLSLLTLDPAAARHDRAVMEVVLAESGVRTAYVNSWDTHHVATFGAFAIGIGSQAYQFRVLDPGDLCEPVAGLSLRPGTTADLPWLTATGFQEDYRKYLDRNELDIALLDGRGAGISMHVPHVLDPGVVSIGMYVDPELRRRGLGRSILSLAARRVLADGRNVVAGCWWRNWPSRATLEAAGLVCAGTVFRLDLDPDVFVRAE
jgi:GNAT superfamily N-acetyltransferase